MFNGFLKTKGNVLAGIGLGLVLFSVMVAYRGKAWTWQRWNIPDGMQSYLDLRVITSGAKTYAAGNDPRLANPDDISGRKLNYPVIWLALYPLGIGPDDTEWLGALSISLFLLGVIIATPPLHNRGVLWLLLALFSPAVMLALERGNTDLLIFFLLAVAIAVRRTAVSLAVILFAFVLKLFPLIAVLMVIVRKRATAGWTFLVTVGFALLYLLFSLGDLMLISANTPRDTWLSYGRNVGWMKVSDANSAAGTVIRLGSYALVAGVLLAAGGSWWRRSPQSTNQQGPLLDAFRVGVACYVGTFLVGNNFIYRLMFLLFAIPQLLVWAREGEAKTTVRLALTGIYLSLWSLVVDNCLQGTPTGVWVSFAISETAHWLAFATLGILLGRTLPDWTVAWVRGRATRVQMEHPPAEAAGSRPV